MRSALPPDEQPALDATLSCSVADDRSGPALGFVPASSGLHGPVAHGPAASLAAALTANNKAMPRAVLANVGRVAPPVGYNGQSAVIDEVPSPDTYVHATSSMPFVRTSRRLPLVVWYA